MPLLLVDGRHLPLGLGRDLDALAHDHVQRQLHVEAARAALGQVRLVGPREHQLPHVDLRAEHLAIRPHCSGDQVITWRSPGDQVRMDLEDDALESVTWSW